MWGFKGFKTTTRVELYEPVDDDAIISSYAGWTGGVKLSDGTMNAKYITKTTSVPSLTRGAARGATSSGGMAIVSSRYLSPLPHCTCNGTSHLPTFDHRLCNGPAAR